MKMVQTTKYVQKNRWSAKKWEKCKNMGFDPGETETNVEVTPTP